MPLPTSFVVKNGSKAHMLGHAAARVGDGDQHILARSDAEFSGDVSGVEVGVLGLDGEPPAIRHGIAGIHTEVEPE